MRKFWRAGLLLVPAALLSAVLIGCSSKPTEDLDDWGEGGGGGKGGGAATMKPMEVAGKATLKGKVVFQGDRPKVDPLDITKDTAHCTNKTNFRWVIDANGGVANVFVWVRPANKNEFIDASSSTPEKMEVKVDQPACAFTPHAFLLFPAFRDPAKPKDFKPTGQVLKVTNEMAINHNADIKGPLGFTDAFGVPSGNTDGITTQKKIKPSMDKEYTVGCTVHPWMSAVFWALEHPYAAVSKPDGTFEIKDLPIPADGKMRVVVWHEDKQWVIGEGSKGEEVTFKKGETLEKNITISK